MCDIPENVETDLTLAAVAVGGAMVVAEKAGSTKAHKMKAKLEKKQDEWARFKKKYPTFFGVVEWLNSIVDSALGYADLITDLLSVQLYLSLGKLPPYSSVVYFRMFAKIVSIFSGFRISPVRVQNLAKWTGVRASIRTAAPEPGASTGRSPITEERRCSPPLPMQSFLKIVWT